MAACGFRYRTLNSRLQHACLSSTRRSYRACRLYARRNPSQEKAQGGLDPALESSVPVEQRPVNELSQLKESFVTSWVSVCLAGSWAAQPGGSSPRFATPAWRHPASLLTTQHLFLEACSSPKSLSLHACGTAGHPATTRVPGTAGRRLLCGFLAPQRPSCSTNI